MDVELKGLKKSFGNVIAVNGEFTGPLSGTTGTFSGILSASGLNVNTSGIGVGDIGSNGGGDSVFGIVNTSNSGSINLNCKNGSGTNNDIFTVTHNSATVDGSLTVNSSSTLSGDVNITGNITASGVLDINGTGTNSLSGPLTVAGNITGTSGVINMTGSGQNQLGGPLSVTGSGTFTGDVIAFSSSDKTLKDNITPIENPIAKLLKLSGNTFDWNGASDYEGKSDTGVIAQEVEALGLPGTVVTRDDGTKAVRYERLIPLLIEAVKELNAKVDALSYVCNFLIFSPRQFIVGN